MKYYINEYKTESIVNGNYFKEHIAKVSYIKDKGYLSLKGDTEYHIFKIRFEFDDESGLIYTSQIFADPDTKEIQSIAFHTRPVEISRMGIEDNTIADKFNAYIDGKNFASYEERYNYTEWFVTCDKAINPKSFQEMVRG